MNYISFKRYKFSTVFKKIYSLKSNFLKIAKYFNINRYNFSRSPRYLNFKKFNLIHIYRYIDPRIYVSYIRKVKFLTSKYLLIHLPLSIIFFAMLYLSIPTFFKYQKSEVKKEICNSINVECKIGGKVSYRFYPTPRLIIKDLTVKQNLEKEKPIFTAEKASILISFKNLLAKDKHQVKKIKLDNFQININLNNLKKYKENFKVKNKIVPIVFKNGQIVFFDKKDYVATISKAKLDLQFSKNSTKAIINGKFLEDDIFININKNIEEKEITDIELKMSNLNLFTKVSFSKLDDDKSFDGKILLKKDKNRFTGIFNYKDNKIAINKSNLKNSFIDGKLEGIVTLLPYFDFNLDLNLNSINFTRFYNYFLSLEENEQKNFFKLNNKINGKLNFSSNKVYSGYNLMNSFESRIKFNNGNIILEQFLINMGKLGAADIIGSINDDKKFRNFIFESNIFVDNQKKFLSKFGIYKKKKISSNFFVSGNFNLENIRASFYEISGNEKLNKEDLDFVENEFNDYMLEDGYKSLFVFSKFKEFLKVVASETN